MKNLFEFEEFRYKEPSMFTKFVKGLRILLELRERRIERSLIMLFNSY